MQAFKRLPSTVLHKLAKGCMSAHVPAGAVLFEEDAKADCMYVVLTGQCHVHARPLPVEVGRISDGESGVLPSAPAQQGGILPGLPTGMYCMLTAPMTSQFADVAIVYTACVRVSSTSIITPVSEGENKTKQDCQQNAHMHSTSAVVAML